MIRYSMFMIRCSTFVAYLHLYFSLARIVKKLPLLITIGIIVVTVGGYFLYDYLARKKETTAWDFVPPETILVYESGPCETCHEQLKKSTIVELIRQAVF